MKFRDIAKTFRANDQYLLWSFLLCFAVRAAIFPFAKNYDGDAPARVTMAIEWLKHPSILLGTNLDTWVWPPLPCYLTGLALSLYNNPLISPRLISLILGSLTVIPFYKIVEMKFNKQTALYASILFTFYTLHVRYSNVATSEAIFLFNLLMGIYFFFNFQRDRKWKPFFLSAFFMNLAAMTRHDTPIFMAVLALLLFISRKDLKLPKRFMISCIYVLSSAIFTILWFLADYHALGDPFNALKIATLDHKNEILHNIQARGYLKNIIYNLAFWPAVVSLSFTPIIALLSAFGFFRALFNKRPIDMLILFIAPYAIYTYSSVFGETMAPFARFSMTFFIFLLPFAAAELYHISSNLKYRNRVVLLGIIFSSMIGFAALLIIFGREGKGFIQQKFDSVSPLSRIPYWIDDITSWTNNNTKADESILLDDYRNEPSVIIFYTKLPKNNFKIIKREDNNLANLIFKYKPRYLIYSPEGQLSSIINLKVSPAELNTIQEASGVRLRLRFSTLYYGIFEIITSNISSPSTELILPPTNGQSRVSMPN